MEPILYFYFILISLLFSAYFVTARFALISILKSGIEIDLNSESLILKLRKTIKTNPENYIATLTIGKHLVLATATIAFAGLLIPFFDNYSQLKSINLILITITAALGILIFGIFIPETLFRFFPNQWLLFYLIPLSLLSIVFYPITRFLFLLTNNSNKNLSKSDHINLVFNRIGSEWMDEQKNSNVTEKLENIETEVKLFKNALDFSKVKLREIMVPRTEIEMLDVNSTFNQLRQTFAETGYSRIILYDGNVDNIVGYVHSSVIFKNPDSFKPFINNVLIVPETMPANKLLSTFIREHRSIAIVVDEFGGTSGMVTSEDILEEIFGEIEDEHDTIDVIEKKLSETEFIFSGRSEIDLINEKYQIN